MVGRYIAGVGALIWNPDNNTYLLLKRASIKDYGAGSWECVTGRLDQGEGFEDALHREVKEEIGIEVTIEFFVGTSHFYRGDPIPENELVGVIYCCSTRTPDAVRKSAEHAEYRWTTVDEALKLASGRDPSRQWLSKVIKRAELIRQHLPDDLRQVYNTEGFETS
jgi:8-oxo-dGTP diphosphatase